MPRPLAVGFARQQRRREARERTEQLRHELLHEFGDLALEPVDRERELAQAAQLVACDPHAHRLLGAGEPPADPRAPLL
jgi:hypothetical protein